MKIAVDTEQSKLPESRNIASGDGWMVSEVVCYAGPRDRPFEEQHQRTSVAVVLSGTFQYRTASGDGLMTPGSLLLGNAGECFVCGHEHGVGDRCLSFSFADDFRARISEAAGLCDLCFRAPRLPVLRPLSPVVAQATQMLHTGSGASWEEIATRLLAESLLMTAAAQPRATPSEASSIARVTRVVRAMEHDLDQPHGLPALSQLAGLSPYHFLRTFEAITGTTPHQYLLRCRLRRAAVRLRSESTRIVDIALDCGFGDVSNFNRAFRAEFGSSPRAYRRFM